MILGPAELAWQAKVTEAANRAGWTVYGQQYSNQRQHEPSIVLVLGQRVIVAYLRTKPARDRTPYVARFHGIPGVEVYVWCPADWAQIRVTLTTGRTQQPDQQADP